MAIQPEDHPIPLMVNSLGFHWGQPNRMAIQVSDSHASMSSMTLHMLANYSTSYPSGVYAGKMWRRQEGTVWYLCWYEDIPGHPGRCAVNFRPIILTDLVELLTSSGT